MYRIMVYRDAIEGKQNPYLNDGEIKSKFLQTEIHFLGFIITPTGIRANPDKVESILTFPEPKNIKQLQSFLGLCNFYRKFQRNYAQTTARLSACLLYTSRCV